MQNAQQPGNNAQHESPTPSARNSAGAIHGTIPFFQRLTCTIAEACEATGLGRTKLYEPIGASCIETTTVGSRRLVLVSSLVALIGSSIPRRDDR